MNFKILALIFIISGQSFASGKNDLNFAGDDQNPTATKIVVAKGGLFAALKNKKGKILSTLKTDSQNEDVREEQKEAFQEQTSDSVLDEARRRSLEQISYDSEHFGNMYNHIDGLLPIKRFALLDSNFYFAQERIDVLIGKSEVLKHFPALPEMLNGEEKSKQAFAIVLCDFVDQTSFSPLSQALDALKSYTRKLLDENVRSGYSSQEDADSLFTNIDKKSKDSTKEWGHSAKCLLKGIIYATRSKDGTIQIPVIEIPGRPRFGEWVGDK